MNVTDIISIAVRHMVEGLMFHDQMMQYFLYLGFPGLARIQEKRYLAESKAMARLQKYSIRAYGRIPNDSGTDARDYIPSAWREGQRGQTELRGPEDALIALENWAGWEEETKKLYGRCYFSASDARDAAASERMAELVRDTDKEHRFAAELLARVRTLEADPGALACIDSTVCKDYERFMGKEVR